MALLRCAARDNFKERVGRQRLGSVGRRPPPCGAGAAGMGGDAGRPRAAAPLPARFHLWRISHLYRPEWRRFMVCIFLASRSFILSAVMCMIAWEILVVGCVPSRPRRGCICRVCPWAGGPRDLRLNRRQIRLGRIA